MTKMRILQVGKFYFPYRGGIESVTQSLSEGLAKAGVDVTVLCSMEKRWASHANEIEGVRVVKVPQFGVIASQPITPSWPDVYRELALEADLIHIHCPNPLAELAMLLAPKNCPVVITYHADVMRQKWVLPVYTPFQKMFLKAVDKIIVPTENHIRYARTLPQFASKCHLIPFGMDPSLMEKTPAVEKVMAELENKYADYALFLGRLVSYKGLNFLIDAMKDVKKNLLIAGDGPERSALELQVKANQLTDRVHFLGRIDGQDLFKALYYASKMVVLPSITAAENFGMIQLEAMCAAKPIITTDLKSGVPAVGEKGRTTLIVPPCNSELLGESMNYLFNYPREAVRMGEMGKHRFDDMYTLDKMVEGHIKLYTSLIEKSNSEKFEPVNSHKNVLDLTSHPVEHLDKKKKVA